MATGKRVSQEKTRQLDQAAGRVASLPPRKPEYTSARRAPPSTGPTATVKVTSATPTGNLYPAVVTLYVAATDTWLDLTAAVWFRDPTGNAPTSGTRYQCTCEGVKTGVPVYIPGIAGLPVDTDPHVDYNLTVAGNDPIANDVAVSTFNPTQLNFDEGSGLGCTLAGSVFTVAMTGAYVTAGGAFHAGVVNTTSGQVMRGNTLCYGTDGVSSGPSVQVQGPITFGTNNFGVTTGGGFVTALKNAGKLDVINSSDPFVVSTVNAVQMSLLNSGGTALSNVTLWPEGLQLQNTLAYAVGTAIGKTGIGGGGDTFTGGICTTLGTAPASNPTNAYNSALFNV